MSSFLDVYAPCPLLPENLSDAFKPFLLPLSRKVSRQTGMMVRFMYHPCKFLAWELIRNRYASSDKKGVQRGKEKKFVTFKRIALFGTLHLRCVFLRLLASSFRLFPSFLFLLLLSNRTFRRTSDPFFCRLRYMCIRTYVRRARVSYVCTQISVKRTRYIRT